MIKTKRGGTRAGSGRKPDPDTKMWHHFHFNADAATVTEFRSLCARHNLSQSATFAHLVSSASKHTEK